ncbi:phosphate acetyltransferase [Candidatus Gracilibacteria bacterium]|nr:phosphate acetyltransferase [Candidatus Gracilibacteria bacterium]
MSIPFLQLVKEKAQAHPARIAFPEMFDERTVRACAEIQKEKTADLVLIGNKSEIVTMCREKNIELDVEACTMIDPKDPVLIERYATALFEQRKAKGMTLDEARKLMNDLNYFAVMVLQMGDADGLITGANAPSHDTLRPALQIIKTKEKFHKVSGFFFMVLEKRLMLFADCMVNPEPNSRELAEIAIDTAETAKRFGIEPKIAMLSFSTNGSAKHPNVDRVREATAMVNSFRPDLMCEGEIQVDAAIVPEVALRKFPGSKIKGEANILIFPNLEAANIAYKLVERLAHAEAIGPILQGMAKPVNDLSRGCSVSDIVHLAAITSVEAHEMKVEGSKATSIR